MLKIADFLAELPQDEHLALSNTVGEGLNQARQPAQCLTDDDEQHMLCAVKGPGNVAGSLHPPRLRNQARTVAALARC
jgi:hypothetical protein